MTTPEIKTFKKGGSRFYVHPDKTFGSVPGVTSVLNMIPKDFLKWWAAKMSAEFAVDNASSWIGMAMNGNRQAAIDVIKRAHLRNTDEAAQFGTDAHDVWERMARGEKLGRQHPGMEPFVRGFSEWLEMYEPEFLHLEATVWSETYGYAGSFDGAARIDGDRLGQEEDAIVILDWKTTRSGVHAEVGLQLNAYANADYIIHPDGSKEDLPEFNAAAVFHGRPEGWQFVPVRLGDDIFDIFKALLLAMPWEKEIKPTILAAPIAKGVFGDE